MYRGAGASRSRTPGQSPASFFDDRCRTADHTVVESARRPARGKEKKKKIGATHRTPQPQNAGLAEVGAGRRGAVQIVAPGRPADSAARGWSHDRDSIFRGPGR
jgi:hypothetical protein